MPIAAGDPARYASLASTAALLVGGLCLLGRLARLGFLAELLSKPVLVGYMAGVAVIMISGQLGKITGVAVEGDEFIPQISSFLGRLNQLHWPTVTMATVLVVMLFILQHLLPRAPGPLMVVAFAATVVALVLRRRHPGRRHRGGTRPQRGRPRRRVRVPGRVRDTGALRALPDHPPVPLTNPAPDRPHPPGTRCGSLFVHAAQTPLDVPGCRASRGRYPATSGSHGQSQGDAGRRDHRVVRR